MKAGMLWLMLVALLCAGFVQAGTYLSLIEVTSIPTNGAGTTTNTGSETVTGEIKAIQLIRGGNTAGATNEFAFYALTNNPMATKLISWTTNGADTVLTPTASAWGQTFRFPMVSQKVQVHTLNANQTGITANIYIIYERP